MLSVKSLMEILAFALQPVDHWVSICLHGCCEDDEFIPLGHGTKEVIAERPFVDQIKSGQLVSVELYFHHLSLGKGGAAREGMDQRLVKIKNKGLGGHMFRHQWPAREGNLSGEMCLYLGDPQILVIGAL